MSKAIFYHAGCPVCLQAEQKVAEAIDNQKYAVEIIHLGENKSRLSEAERAGVKSVPEIIQTKPLPSSLIATPDKSPCQYRIPVGLQSETSADKKPPPPAHITFSLNTLKFFVTFVTFVVVIQYPLPSHFCAFSRLFVAKIPFSPNL